MHGQEPTRGVGGSFAQDGKGAGGLLVGDPAGLLPQGDGAQLQLLDLVHVADHHHTLLGQGQSAREAGGVEGGHIAYLLSASSIYHMECKESGHETTRCDDMRMTAAQHR